MQVLLIAWLRIDVEGTVREVTVAGGIGEASEGAVGVGRKAEIIIEKSVLIDAERSRYCRAVSESAVDGPKNVGSCLCAEEKQRTREGRQNLGPGFHNCPKKINIGYRDPNFAKDQIRFLPFPGKKPNP